MGIGGDVLRLFGVRLGMLRQHPPRPLVLPDAPGEPAATAVRPLPRIGIVTPVFDGERFIERTIRSVLEQRYPNLFYVVKDGGSRDGTMAVVDGWRDQIDAVVSAPDGGQAAAINQGFALLPPDVEIMAWLNGDDLLLPGALDFVARYFVDHPDVDVVYGDRVLIDEDDREIGRWVMPGHDPEVLSWVSYVPQETLFWRRSAWRAVGAALDESFAFAMDWDLLLRLRDSGARMVCLPRFLGAFRIHDSQKTSAQMHDIGAAEMRRIRVREFGREPHPWEIAVRILPFLGRHVLRHWRYRLSGRG